MAEISGYWGGTTVGDATSAPYDDAEFADILRILLLADPETDAVIAGYLNDLSITGASSPVNYNTGAALVNGWWYKNTTSTTIAVSTPAVSTRQDYLILSKDAGAQTVRVKDLQGVEGGGLPTLTQNATSWEVALYSLTITTAGVITLTDLRRYATSPLAGVYREASLAANDSSHTSGAWNSLGAGVSFELTAGTWLVSGQVDFAFDATSPNNVREARIYNTTSSSAVTTSPWRLDGIALGGRQQISLAPTPITITARNVLELQFWAGDTDDVVYGTTYTGTRMFALRLSTLPSN